MHLQVIQRKIHEIRGYKVILDFDIADLYETETKVINQAIKRNIARFPAKFLFLLFCQDAVTNCDRILAEKKEQNSSALRIY